MKTPFPPVLSRLTLILVTLGLLGASPRESAAFCGFYVSKADVSLYNKASQVAVVRHEGKTVISMLNDFDGNLKEFALVVPVPEVLAEGQIHVADKALFDHLDAYSAPRLVEYFDPDPCQIMKKELSMSGLTAEAPAVGMARGDKDKSLGVTVEAKYTVGEYDIVILSAKQSDGLETWLRQNGYRIPAGASRALRPYISQNMKFFVAKVNLKEQLKTGVKYLRPIQFAFESPKFMLPIRLGMINSKGPQDLIVYMLSAEGRVETTNYRTVRLPSNMDIPEYVKDEFAPFYTAMFDRAVQKEGGRAVFTEYVWNMGWCDPCASDPLSREELQELGVFWLDDPQSRGALPVTLTRLHVRYTRETFPEDLVFQETKDQENFQGRYVLRHAWTGSDQGCPRAREYRREVRRRREVEATTLAELTGWPLAEIRGKMDLRGDVETEPWWKKIWNN